MPLMARSPSLPRSPPSPRDAADEGGRGLMGIEELQVALHGLRMAGVLFLYVLLRAGTIM